MAIAVVGVVLGFGVATWLFRELANPNANPNPNPHPHTGPGIMNHFLDLDTNSI